jgi:hypothetical protein
LEIDPAKAEILGKKTGAAIEDFLQSFAGPQWISEFEN